MKLEELEASVPFDQFSRQYQVANIINCLRAKGESYKILDVGGYKGKTADFMPEDKVTILDVFDVKEKNYVQGDALALPFEDNSFDFITSFDVLEHIPKHKRELFIKENARVAKRGVIVAFPHQTISNEQAEIALNHLHRRLHNKEHRWLKEHIEYTLPNFKIIKKYVSGVGLHAISFASNELSMWFVMQAAIFHNSKYPLAAPQLVDLNSYYNRSFKYDGGGNPGNSYRLIMCCMKNEEDRNILKKEFSKRDQPIETERRIQLLNKIENYEYTLLDKTNKELSSYKDMYSHEESRADSLEAHNKQLLVQYSIIEDRFNNTLLKKTAAAANKMLKRDK